jgi:hypothetical protein
MRCEAAPRRLSPIALLNVQHRFAGEFGALLDEGEARFGFRAHQALDRRCRVGAVLGHQITLRSVRFPGSMVVSLSYAGTQESESLMMSLLLEL